jgi:hypothetical protein
VTDRRERLAKNEALFRDVNERVEEIATEHMDPETVEFLCECVDIECLTRVNLSVETYEQVRSDAAHFVLTPGHERPDVEDVIERHPGYVIVRKHPDTQAAVEEWDRRTD